MMQINQNNYQVRGFAARQQRLDIERIAQQVFEQDIHNIFFAGSGGSITTIMPFARMICQNSLLPAYEMEAGELLTSDYKQLNQHSLVVIMAKTGTAVETVELARTCHENNIPVIGFCIVKNAPIQQYLRWTIWLDESCSPVRFMPLYYFVFKLLNLRGEFDEYDEFANQVGLLPNAMSDIVQQFSPKAKTFAENYADEDFQLWIYSGMNNGESLKYSACIAEELFRQKTQWMNAAEFFHGCLEIVDNTTCIILLKGEDRARSLDERVERFLQKYAYEKLTVIDTRDYELPGIDSRYRAYFSPVILNLCLVESLTPIMQERTGKSQKTRRYYNVVEY